MINNKTKLFFSISNNPGSSGSIMHNFLKLQEEIQFIIL